MIARDGVAQWVARLYKQIDHDPPLIRRGVTSDEYSLHRLNLHQEFQGRKGHLKVNSNTRGYEQPIR